MGIRLAVLVAALAVALSVVSAAGAGTGGRSLSTTLTGAEEAPDPGDPDATGQADLRLNQGKNRVCFDVNWTGIDGTVFAGHIHVGPPGVAGPIVVTLFSGSFAGTDAVSDCVGDVDRGLIKAIRKDPSDYYVNVHSQPNFPNGAVRGQLSK
ncbi:MAG TPA: CHRD domain-containing protein [Solirubrobacterales bacterium]|nr:CHRD domain-containing protein [Solirubrobacterales bacterium]